jgi:hypothetical protein
MTVEFHPTVQRDFNRALDYYEAVVRRSFTHSG